MIIVMFTVFVLMTPNIAEASKDTTWSKTFTDKLNYYWSWDSNRTTPVCINSSYCGGS